MKSCAPIQRRLTEPVFVLGSAARWLLLAGTCIALSPLRAAEAPRQEPSSAQEIPLERCDVLPVLRVLIGGEERRLLVDTGSTTLLNLNSFAEGKAKEIHIDSWRGSVATSAREVTVKELVLAGYRIGPLRLPAIDLTPIEIACGGRIDGILGVDLLEKLGVTLDLKRRIALLGSDTGKLGENSRLNEYRDSLQACIAAFNQADISLLSHCIDPQVVLFTTWGEVRGRRQMLDHLQQRYFNLAPPARFDLRPSEFRLLGDVAWCRYDYTITLPDQSIKASGMAICRKSEGRWRLLSMHNSLDSDR